MKIYKFLLSIVIFSLILSSCKKYLDVQTDSRQGFAETADDCQLLLDNYTVMNTGYPSDGELSADDYFIQPNNYNSIASQEDRDLYIWSANARRAAAAPQWQNPYKVVLQANLVLETLQKLQGGSTDPVTLNTLKGSALFFRAYAFWNVAQLYAKPYSAASAGQDLGIPLRMTTDLNEKSSRGTLQQTYDRIIQDLQDAVTLLPPTSSVPTRPNKAAAYAMLARTYLSMENYPNALSAASSALQLNSQLLNYYDPTVISLSSNTPFSPRFNKEVIFHSITNPGKTLVPNLNTAKLDPDLVASYDSNDLRGKIFFKPIASDTTYRFTGSYEGSFFASNFFNGLAVDELYLVRAECYARTNKPTEAMADLNTLLATRWATGTYVNMIASSADDALTKVLTERRKELLMRAQRWTDLRRLNKDPRFSKTLIRAKPINGTTYKLPPNDLRYVLLIPDEVILNSGIQQNPR
ncbi:tetratricopeptide (TPR) repeat protein [Pedobacter cryoconitis]|uniref:Tetratricopeptide (TPR) repeat protein n=1 Tax=Pedobacter cryoconitis TaxID=188932 RepID=A0A7W8YRR1_9SPHI|nr:RagB/SusD family nutrient uptake outer membrane protein [Pedobacter cryoconitis]MBB5620637.1 tetratricopeptide (TPR) repeat protein [Pedobacter cryoconitis]